MRSSKNGLLISAVFFIPIVASTYGAHADTSQSGKQQSGSLYPTSIAAPVRLSSGVMEHETAEKHAPTMNVHAAPTVQNFEIPSLAAALGPAAYILNEVSAGDEFNAAIRRAVGRHPSYHAQMTELVSADADRRRAKSSLYPQLSTVFRGDYSLAREFDANTNNITESQRPNEQFTVGLSASQLLYDGGSTFQRIKSARAKDSEAKNSMQVRSNELSLIALSTYHDFATQQALVSLGTAFIVRHEEILRDVKERERLGAGSMADVTRAQARLASAEARVLGLIEGKQLAGIRYRRLFEAEPGILLRPVFSELSLDTRDEVVAAAGTRSPEIAVATARWKSAQADYKAAKGARRPEVRLSVDATKFDIFDNADEFDLRAGLNVSYNIFDGGSRAADIAQAGAHARHSKFGQEQVRQDVTRDAAIAYERRNGALARLKAFEKAVIAHNQTRLLVMERFRVSRGDLIDVLQAENDYFEAAIAYLNGLAISDMTAYGVMEFTGELLQMFSPEDAASHAMMPKMDHGAASREGH